MDDWWESFLSDEALQRAAPRLIHSDLWPDNLLVDATGKRLLGVIDFGDACLGDPAHDFATLRHFGEPFLRSCINAYVGMMGPLDEDFEHRLNRYWELRTGSFYSIRASLRADDAMELNDCLEKLRRGAILSQR